MKSCLRHREIITLSFYNEIFCYAENEIFCYAENEIKSVSFVVADLIAAFVRSGQ